MADGHLVGAQSRNAHSAKIRKYTIPNEALRLSFRPIVFESSGLFHKDVIKFLTHLATNAAEIRKIDANVLLNYFMKRLSMCLQVSFADNIINRIHDINGQRNGISLRAVNSHDIFEDAGVSRV